PALAARAGGAVRGRPRRVRRAPGRARRRAGTGLRTGGRVHRDDGGRRLRPRPRRRGRPELRRPMTGPVRAEHAAVISGVGQSVVGRQVDRSGLQLTIDAVLAAVADAGLELDDVDGLAMFPGGGAANLPGYASGNLYEVQDALRLRTTWRQGQVEGMSLPFYGPVMAVAAGQARHVVVYRTVKEGSAARSAGGRPAYGATRPAAEGPLAWLLPVGMLSPVVQVAPYATRYMHD